MRDWVGEGAKWGGKWILNSEGLRSFLSLSPVKNPIAGASPPALKGRNSLVWDI